MITQLLATWIPALLIALSGVMKLSGNAKLLEGMTTLGVRTNRSAAPFACGAPNGVRMISMPENAVIGFVSFG